MTSLAWLDRAACRGTDLNIWFPTTSPGRNGARASAVEYAARWCDACPVRRECEAWAAGQRYGIWHGEDKEA